MYYLLLILATVCFSIQFVFNKMYERDVGAGFLPCCSFLLIGSAVFGGILCVLEGFQIEATAYSWLMALLGSLICVVTGYFGILALSISDLAKYSLYLMLGGMAVPFVYGFLFNGDAVTWQKIVCFVTIAAALIVNARGDGTQKKDDWRAWMCYIAIFLFNGLSGVVATIHQLPPEGAVAVSANDYTILIMACNIIIAGAALLIGRLRGMGFPKAQDKKTNIRSLMAAGGYGVVNGIGSILLLISVLHIEPSVQYPIVTGGCVVLSVIFGLFFGEKITRKNAVCAAITLLGTLVLMVP